ncbi:mycothiol transferase [Streptomyces jumonjinensis]|uniref:mycothiol transferase n=1 Tax=Streptomyces jumonjinensis TaxID=1945 RepID=UPI0037A1C83E
MTTSSDSSETSASSLPGERGELLRALAEQRELLLLTVRGITDVQAVQRTTVSELTLGGIVKHMARGELVWTQILVKADGELPDLDRSVPLPRTPWSPPETVYWPARRILLHLIRETAQHAGHADIIREALDGANTTAQR